MMNRLTVMMNLLAVKLEPFDPIEYFFYNSSGVLFLQVMLYIKAFKTDKFCKQNILLQGLSSEQYRMNEK